MTEGSKVYTLGEVDPEAISLLFKERDALQARVAELTSVAEHGEIREQKIKKEFERVCGERDAALAKLRELEAQEPVGAVLQSATNYDSTWSFICSSKQYLKTGIPIYTRPIPAQPTARTYMDGYSNGKQWALEEAAKVCETYAQDCERCETTLYGGIRASTAESLGTSIRKLGEGL